MKRVLINGIGRVLGARVARQLCEHDDVSVIGLASHEPVASVGSAEWFIARLNGQQWVELLQAEEIDTVIHLNFAGIDSSIKSHEQAVKQNVLGTMELLGACIHAGVEQVVVRSHSWVYGASPLNPMMMDEHRPVARTCLHGFLRDIAEVESFMSEFAAQHPQMRIVSLRMAPLIGGWSPLMDYFAQPGPRMLLGFDPSIQLLHIEDAVDALVHFSINPCSGAFNIAADDAVCISQAIRLSGQQPLPTLEAMIKPSAQYGDRTQLRPWPVDINFLRHSCIVDTHRAKQELGWSPTHSIAESISALRRNGHVSTDQAASEAALRAFLSRKR